MFLNDETKIRRYHSIISWNDWRKPRKTSSRTANVPTEIRTEYLPNTNLQHYRYTNLLDHIPLDWRNTRISMLKTENYFLIMGCADMLSCKWVLWLLRAYTLWLPHIRMVWREEIYQTKKKHSKKTHSMKYSVYLQNNLSVWARASRKRGNWHRVCAELESCASARIINNLPVAPLKLEIRVAGC